MRKVLILVLIMIATTIATVQAEVNVSETGFSASTLTANDVDCKKCHTDTPHVIHAQKAAASCENCHGDKLSVAIPQCTKCHNGPIHKVHAGKIGKGCEYCHKTIGPVHTNLIGEAVCSHCHKDLVEVHGQNQSCQKCHKTPPDIVKPLKAEGMVLVCQNCHPAASVATIHGEIEDKQGCYNCHKGTSNINDSDIPHQIHKDKAACKDCHEENGRVFVPQCIKCHKIDELHAYNKIGKLTAQSGLTCSICHADISKPVETAPKAKEIKETVKEPDIILPIKGEDKKSEAKETGEAKGTPGFEIAPGIVVLYIMARRINK